MVDETIEQLISPDKDSTVKEIQTALYLHSRLTEDSNTKISEMYKILVTGNGHPSFQERVRRLELITSFFMWLGGGLVISIGLLLFDLFTGKVSLIFH